MLIGWLVEVGRKEHMRKEPPLVSCAFGWGKVCHLYQDCLDVNGKHYVLAELKDIRPIYRKVMGVSSARLELVFGRKKVVLRGIVALEDLSKIVEYLSAECSSRSDLESTDCDQTSSSEQTDETPSEAGEWDSQEYRRGAPLLYDGKNVPSTVGAITSSQDRHPAGTSEELSQSELAKITTLPVEVPGWLRLLQEQHERRQKRVRVERSLREYGFDLEKLAQRLQLEPLPCVQVPVRLLPGEEAHYRTDATLCGERIGEPMRYVYPALDYGLLILTNLRLIYIGRKSQLVLDYARLLHVSRLRGALAFDADHWRKRVIFELSRPLECAMYLECILEHFAQSEEPGVGNEGPQEMELPGGELGDVPQTLLSSTEFNTGEPLTSRCVDTTPLPMCNWDMADTLATLEALERENTANLEAYEE